jgi:hypothetical protein
LIPAQVYQFNRPEAVTIGNQDHGGVAVPMTVLAGGPHELPDLDFS